MTASPDVKEAVERAKNTLRYDQELVPAERPPGPMTWRKTPWRTISAEDLELILSDHARLSRLVEDAGEALALAVPLLEAWADDASNDVGACVQEGGKPTEDELQRMRTSAMIATRAAQAHKAIKSQTPGDGDE